MRELVSLGDTSSGLSLQHQENLSKLQDLDYAKAISEFTQQQVQLEAAQKSFVQISGLSLFNYL
jgi:flagellar hook-associated protein 3 FlgL